jgi:hypothetical protein
MELYKQKLTRPCNRQENRRMYKTPSCWDCEHIRVGRQFYRVCEIIPSQHIWSSGPENERLENNTVVAENCEYFKLASELSPNLEALIDEDE